MATIKVSVYTLWLSIFFSFNLLGQYSEKQSFVYKGNSYDIFIIKLDSSLAKQCSFVENRSLMGEKDFFMSYPKKTFFAISASIIDNNCVPMGLFVKDSKRIKELNTTISGNGSFYSIQPNGVIYITQQNEINVATTPDFVQTSIDLKLGIQTGPILVNKGSINSTFTIASNNKYIRCGVGIFTYINGQYIVFAKSNKPVNFYDFADLFITKYKCYNALNLESGANASIHLPAHSISRLNNSIHQCRYFVIQL